MFLNFDKKRVCWTTTKTSKQDGFPVFDDDHCYEFDDSNKAFANAIFARVQPGSVLYPDYPVLDLASEQGTSDNAIVVNDDEENDPELKAAIAASLAEIQQESEVSLAELECSQRVINQSQMEMEPDEGDSEHEASQMLDESVFEFRELLHGPCTLDQITPGLSLFSNSTTAASRRLCRDLALAELAAEKVVLVTRAVTESGDELAHGCCCCVVESLWREKLLDMRKNASRSTVACLVDLGKRFPAAMLQTIVVPIWSAKEFRTAHCDFLSRLIKDSSSDFRSSLASELFSYGLDPMTELHINVMQTIFTKKAKISQPAVQSLMTTLVKHSDSMKTNNKFSKLLLSMMETQDPAVLSSGVDALSRCINDQETVLKSSLEKALDKIEKTN